MTRSNPVPRLARAFKRAHGLLTMHVGRIGSAVPLSDDWGFDRGQPIDRHYIEAFLATNSADVRGNVLEVADNSYSKLFGGKRIERQDVLHVSPGIAGATIVGDLVDPATLPSSRFDCIILTQTLHLIFDMRAAVEQLHRALRPGGVALITVPGISPIDRGEWKDSWYWSLTGTALSRLLSGPFRPEDVSVTTYGNLYAATAFLHGAAVEEASAKKLKTRDPAYPVSVAARAQRASP